MNEFTNQASRFDVVGQCRLEDNLVDRVVSGLTYPH